MLWLAGIAATAGACADAEPKAVSSGRAVREPTVTMPSPGPAPRVTAAEMLCRESWGAQAPRTGGRPHTLGRMTIHHTAVTLGDNRLSPARLRQHQRYHQDAQSWIDIAYHVSVDRNGNVFELRSTDIADDTATDYDPAGHFLVVCEGNFDEEPVSEQQLHGAALAFAWAATRFGIPTDTIAGHRDATAATACPGAGLYGHVKSGDLRRRVDALLADGGTVDMRRVCGPEATAAVADIEAGRR